MKKSFLIGLVLALTSMAITLNAAKADDHYDMCRNLTAQLLDKYLQCAAMPAGPAADACWQQYDDMAAAMVLICTPQQ